MIRVVPERNHEILSVLNEPVHAIHSKNVPGRFKPYDRDIISKAYKEMLDKEKYHSFIAYDGEIAVGYALVYVRDYKENAFQYAYLGIHIEQFGVVESHRRKGIGSQLMREVEILARKIGASQLELTCWDVNFDGLSFWNKLGFKRNYGFFTRTM